MRTKQTSKRIRTLRRGKLALALVAAMAAPMAMAQSLPEFGNVVPGSGAATIGPQVGNQMTVTQTTKGAIIEWGTFNIATGYGVTFDQQFGASSVTLNRVVGFGYGVGGCFNFAGCAPTSSNINGSLTGVGSIFIVNSAGIAFNSTGTDQINVGSLVASTMDITNSDFLSGVATGHYQFQAATDPNNVNGVVNSGQITTRAGGSVGFIGSVLGNVGDTATMTTPGGSVVLGSGNQVTLDFFGDGLTQVTVTGPGVSQQAPPTNNNSGVTNGIAFNSGTIAADGGQILMRVGAVAGNTQPSIWNAGTLQARSLVTRAGRVELTAPGGSIVMGLRPTGDLQPGVIDVSGGAFAGGTALLDGGYVALWGDSASPNGSSRIDASGNAGGGQVDIKSSTAILLNGGTSIRANALSAGDGGSISLTASTNILAFGNLEASSGASSGNGGLIDISATSATGVVGVNNLYADGGATGTGGQIKVSGATVASIGALSAKGGKNGGSVELRGNRVALGETSSVNADGGTGTGGSIVAAADTALVVFGPLSARGGTAGGSIVTSSGGQFDLRGISVDAGSAGTAGTWTVEAPQLTVINGSDTGTDTTQLLGTTIQDGDINHALEAGTSVVLQTTQSFIDFDAAQIVSYFDGPLSLNVNAAGYILGDDFSITSLGGPLDMAFNANATGDGGGIGFGNGVLSSNGGDILMYGESDPLAGLATGAGSGISLTSVTMTTNGGDVLMRGGSSNLRGGGPNDAGVRLGGTTINTAGGDIDIYGLGALAASGVSAQNSSLISGAGDVSVVGVAAGTGDGIHFDSTSVSTEGGDMDFDGTGGGFGFFDVSTLYSGGGDIRIRGEGGSEDGIYFGGGIHSAGGNIDLYGVSTDATGLVFYSGNFDGISSAGGQIKIEGNGATGGAALFGDGYGTSSIDGGGGPITIIGSASGADALGVLLSRINVTGGSGDVTVRGSAAAGVGVSFADGARITTTTGAINLYGTGADFGLDIAEGGVQTDSGNILLEGDATATTATAGVRVTGDGLVTDGGDIKITGTSAGGVGVQLGDGGAFAIGSGGGAITIEGTGIDAGVLMQGNQVASGGGAVSITGNGATTGVSLDGSDVNSAGGDIGINGTASAAGGTGVDLTNARLSAGAGDVVVLGNAAAGTGIGFGGGSGISTTSGGISLTGIGAEVGLVINGDLTTETGHFDLRGRGTGSASNGLVIGQGVSIVTDGGGIDLSGEGGSGAGINLGSGSLVDAGNSLVVLRAANDGSSDAIRLQGAIHSDLGVNLRPGGVDANGGLTDHVDDEILIGGASGFSLSGAELAMIDAPELVIGSSLHAGAIRVLTATSRDGNLTLQNDGGSGGIDIQAAVNVGDGTLALSSGGSVTQTSAGAISAHTLLANAGGDVLLTTAQNNVASTTLGGSAGGEFEFKDVDGLAIGNVTATGFDASTGGLSNLSANGINANGDVFVQNLAGDLILNSDVVGNNITLVTAGRLQNLGNASLIASGNWRVWANTWEGETRGGLAGSGDLPNLYGCTFNGACGVTVPLTDNHFIYVQQPTAVITFDSFSREYGLANPAFTYSVTGAILGDTAANVASGTATTTATIASDVGNYAISGIFTSASGYRFQLVPGTLAITPATLFFTADPSVRYLGSPNPDFTGTITGFRNGDTEGSVFGSGNIWSSPAGFLSQVGFYPINGGTTARNYVFTQAPGNATALQIIPLPQLSSTPIDLVRETVNTYVYDRNFGGAPVCAVNSSLEDQKLASAGDDLSTEWAKVRSRPNLTNCFETESKNGCGSF